MGSTMGSRSVLTDMAGRAIARQLTTLELTQSAHPTSQLQLVVGLSSIDWQAGPDAEGGCLPGAMRSLGIALV